MSTIEVVYVSEAKKLLDEARSQMDFSPDKALRAARKSHELYRKVGDAEGTFQAFRALLQAMFAGDIAGAFDLAEQELEAARASGDEVKLGMKLLALADLHLANECGEDAFRVATEAQQIFSTAGNRRFEAEAALSQSSAQVLLDNMDKSRSLVEEASMLAKAVGDKDLSARCWHMISSVTEGEEALRATTMARDLFIEIGDRTSQAVVISNMSEVLLSSGRVQEGTDAANEAMSMFGELGLHSAQVNAFRAILFDKIDTGKIREALPLLQDKLDQLENAGQPSAQAHLLLVAADVYMADGDAVAAVNAATEAKSLFETMDEPRHIGAAILKLANLDLEQGKYDEAIELARKAGKIFQEQGMRGMEHEAKAVEATAYTEKGEPEKSPLRQDALSQLEALAKAADHGDTKKFGKAMRGVVNSGGMTGRDYGAAVDATGSKDEIAMKRLLASSESGYAVRAQEAHPSHLYAQFRSNGLQYGPAFRTIKSVYTRDKGTTDAQIFVVLQLDKNRQEWEKKLAFSHPGIADGSLQAQLSLH